MANLKFTRKSDLGDKNRFWKMSTHVKKREKTYEYLCTFVVVAFVLRLVYI